MVYAAIRVMSVRDRQWARVPGRAWRKDPKDVLDQAVRTLVIYLDRFDLLTERSIAAF